MHVYGCNLSILWVPLKNRIPKFNTIAIFGHPVSRSWLRPCPEKKPGKNVTRWWCSLPRQTPTLNATGHDLLNALYDTQDPYTYGSLRGGCSIVHLHWMWIEYSISTRESGKPGNLGDYVNLVNVYFSGYANACMKLISFFDIFVVVVGYFWTPGVIQDPFLISSEWEWSCCNDPAPGWRVWVWMGFSFQGGCAGLGTWDAFNSGPL